jgi:hypothetical protein
MRPQNVPRINHCVWNATCVMRARESKLCVYGHQVGTLGCLEKEAFCGRDTYNVSLRGQARAAKFQ